MLTGKAIAEFKEEMLLDVDTTIKQFERLKIKIRAVMTEDDLNDVISYLKTVRK